MEIQSDQYAAGKSDLSTPGVACKSALNESDLVQMSNCEHDFDTSGQQQREMDSQNQDCVQNAGKSDQGARKSDQDGYESVGDSGQILSDLGQTLENVSNFVETSDLNTTRELKQTPRESDQVYDKSDQVYDKSDPVVCDVRQKTTTNGCADGKIDHSITDMCKIYHSISDLENRSANIGESEDIFNGGDQQEALAKKDQSINDLGQRSNSAAAELEKTTLTASLQPALRVIRSHPSMLAHLAARNEIQQTSF
jgi:hypothetical protein